MSESPKRLIADVERLAHTQVNDCYQCGKCTAGCPRAGVMDAGPTRLIRLVQTGDVLEAAACESVWQCVSCLTCTTRCPKSVNIAGVVDALRQISVERNITARKYSRTVLFQKEFLRNIRRNGRTNELELVAAWKLVAFFDDWSPFKALADARLGIPMLTRHKLHFKPGSPVKDKAVVRRIFDRCAAKRKSETEQEQD
ncbi:MAG: 4Fe-4S dicluster domain-containing protein [Thermoguttaceae bacterium]|nr:4Fe-4S dicluster domain-containing protein [Thermoguttaceae bacterium]